MDETPDADPERALEDSLLRLRREALQRRSRELGVAIAECQRSGRDCTELLRQWKECEDQLRLLTGSTGAGRSGGPIPEGRGGRRDG